MFWEQRWVFVSATHFKIPLTINVQLTIPISQEVVPNITLSNFVQVASWATRKTRSRIGLQLNRKFGSSLTIRVKNIQPQNIRVWIIEMLQRLIHNSMFIQEVLCLIVILMYMIQYIRNLVQFRGCRPDVIQTLNLVKSWQLSYDIKAYQENQIPSFKRQIHNKEPK